MHLSKKSPRRSPASATQLPPEIIEISADLFPGPLETHLETDPEVPNEQFLVLTVHASGRAKELVQRRRPRGGNEAGNQHPTLAYLYYRMITGDD